MTKNSQRKHIKRTEKLVTFLMVSLVTCEWNLTQACSIRPYEVHKLMTKIHGLKLECETLKIEAVEREKIIRRAEHQSQQIVKRKSRLSHYNWQIQINNRFLPFEDTTEMWMKKKMAIKKKYSLII